MPISQSMGYSVSYTQYNTSALSCSQANAFGDSVDYVRLLRFVFKFSVVGSLPHLCNSST